MVNPHPVQDPELDALVIGAGVTGLYQLYKLAELGLNARAYEQESGLGGVWYRNRYPGARFDSESDIYTYSFSEEILQKWDWKERFSPQADNLQYLEFAADVMGVRDSIVFDMTVVRAVFVEDNPQWEVHFADGSVVTTRYLITAVGALSLPTYPRIQGIDSFSGLALHTAKWPHDPNGGLGGQKFDFSDKRVGVFGTGASGVHVIEQLGAEAAELFVFQRRPGWTTPLKNSVLTADDMAEIRANYEKTFELCRTSWAAFAHQMSTDSIFDATDEEREAFFEKLYAAGGMTFQMANYHDAYATEEANSLVDDFLERKIRARVKNPAVADKLIPTEPFASRRVASETRLYETFNRDNVHLVDLRDTPVEEITPDGVRTSAEEIPLDVIIYATGFDAILGAINHLDIVGRGGRTLKSKWDDKIKTYLGLQIADFPNLFTLLGPHSGAAPTNVPRGAEMHVEWLSEMLAHVKRHGVVLVEPTQEAEDQYTDLVWDAFSKAPMAQVESYFTGVNSNVPGRTERMPVVYMGGLPSYRQLCEEIATEGYRGFEMFTPERLSGTEFFDSGDSSNAAFA
ncbi:flavin-containing monooxygenase [Rhodococcus opacus]|uniref:flavin-containing monooxygenase n=1 Tax=Rhodococcus opacus TaxID=37919 RepID=UPI002473C755|nr:NAD(P)/FAD-dependent oxidoreductase [Rhodococcus opacus]MDH6291319.1 cation diffusion facilitator CzcD-associated flavoprotein CzcO [Rhodococcus opacus]